MTAEWCSTTIDAACNIEYGTRVVQKRDGGSVFPVYGGGGATFFMDTANRESRVVVSRFGMSEECTRFVDGRFFLNDSGLTLSPKDVESLLPTFLDRLILSLNREIFSLGRGAAQKNLDVPAFKALRISYPSSIADQRRIVAILDEAFEGIATAKAHAERSLRNATEVVEVLKDACFRELLVGGVRQVRLAEVASFRNGVNYTKESRGQEVLVVGVKDFQSKFWAPLESLDRVTLDGPLHEADRLNEGDIVFVRSNGNPALIGRCLLVGPVGEQTTHSGFTIKMRLMDKSLCPAYVCHFLKSGRIRRQLVDGGNGANIKSLNQGTLSAITVPVPVVSVQHGVIERVSRLVEERDRIDALYQRKLAALDELKQSLLHQAFSGTL